MAIIIDNEFIVLSCENCRHPCRNFHSLHHSPNIKSIFAIYYLNERQVLALLLSFHLIELLLVYCAGAIVHIRM